MSKVLVVAPYPYLPYQSGGQRLIARFLHHLGKLHEVTVITVEGTNTQLATSYKCLPLLKASFFRYTDLSLVNKVTDLVKAEHFQYVIWEHPYLAWVAKRVKKKTGVHTIIHTHNIEHLRFRSTGRWWWPILRKYEKNAFKTADELFFISEEDRSFAINNWNIPVQKTKLVPYGIEEERYPADRSESRNKVLSLHSIPTANKLVLFNGMLAYKPNLDALKVILEVINPILKAQVNFEYTILICGKGLPAELNELLAYKDSNIIYAGFVPDIDLYYKAADVFMNPVLSGGGVKTKLVEAIAQGTTVVSTASGAAGMDATIAGEKLLIAADDNWTEYCALVMRATVDNPKTPDTYYQFYYWGNIVSKLLFPLSSS